MGLESAGQRVQGFNRDLISIQPRLTGFKGRPIEPANMGTPGPLPGRWRYIEGAQRTRDLSAFGIRGSNCDTQY
eukprot:8489451-Heterocapsa_arctica.AAC.1